MSSPRSSLNLQELDNATDLKFTRLNVNQINEATLALLKKLEKLITSINAAKFVPAKYRNKYIHASAKLGIYYGFNQRKSNKTKEFFNNPLFKDAIVLFKEDIKTRYDSLAALELNESAYAKEMLDIFQTELDVAEIETQMLYADIIDGVTYTVAEQEIQLKKRAAYYVTLETNAKRFGASAEQMRDITLSKAFIDRYIALMKHRASFNNTLAPKKRIKISKEAQSILEKSLETIKPFEKDFTDSILDIAEMYHLIGVTLKEQNQLQQSEQVLLTAMEKWSDYYKLNNSYYPVMFITQQSLADVYRRQGRYKEAHDLLVKSIDQQIAFYGTEENTDVAKSYHYLGEVFEDLSDYEVATQWFGKSLEIKKTVAPNMMWMTKDAIYRVERKLQTSAELIDTFLPAFPKFNWNDHNTFKDYDANSISIDLQVLMNNELSNFQKAMVARRTLQLGTYFNHIKRSPYQAIQFNEYAEANLIDPVQKAWAKNHVAFSLQQMLAAYNADAKDELKNNGAVSEETNNEIAALMTKGREYYTQLIAEFGSKDRSVEETAILAFAYCIKALFEWELKNQRDSVESYREAIRLYDAANIKDDQVARVKNRYAQILSELEVHPDGHPTPLSVFEELEVYWHDFAHDNPYPTRFHHSFGDFLKKLYLQNKDIAYLERALEKYKRAEAILSSQLDAKGQPREAGYLKDVKGFIQSTEDTLSKAKSNPRLSFLTAPSAPPVLTLTTKDEADATATTTVTRKSSRG